MFNNYFMLSIIFFPFWIFFCIIFVIIIIIIIIIVYNYFCDII